MTLNKISVYLILYFLVFAVFGNAMFNKFVWDDDDLIVANPYIKDIKFIPSLFIGDLASSIAIHHNQTFYYRPLSMLSFMLDYKIWRLNPSGYHWTNIVLHLFNTIMVFLLICEITKNINVSFLTGAIFAVHPIHVEAVVPIFNRMGLQSVFFMLLSLLIFIRSGNFSRPLFLAAALFSYVCALFSKEEAIILPLIFLCYDYFYLSGFKFKKIFLLRKAVFYITSFFISLLFLWIRQINLGSQTQLNFLGLSRQAAPLLAHNLFFHLLTVIKVIGGYAVKSFLPISLSPVYFIKPISHILDYKVLIASAILGLMVFAFWYFRNKHRDISLFIILFFVGILIYSNILPVVPAYMFQERFLYFASISACFILAVLMVNIFVKLRLRFNSKLIAGILPAALLFSFSTFTAISNYAWRTNLSLWSDAVKKNPESQLALFNLGTAYMTAGNYTEAINNLNKSLSLSGPKLLPSVYLAKVNLAKIYMESGSNNQALPELKEALAVARQANINPFAVYDRLGVLYDQLNNSAEAENYFLRALEINDNFAVTHYNLGVFYYKRQDYQKAQGQFKQALDLDPDLAYAMLGLSMAYNAMGEAEAAQEMYKRAIEIDPKIDVAKQGNSKVF